MNPPPAAACDKPRTELGDKFDYPRLPRPRSSAGGALPLPVLERKIDRWIEAQKAG
jgi:uncharacterized protein (DUF885 family)